MDENLIQLVYSEECKKFNKIIYVLTIITPSKTRGVQLFPIILLARCSSKVYIFACLLDFGREEAINNLLLIMAFLLIIASFYFILELKSTPITVIDEKILIFSPWNLFREITSLQFLSYSMSLILTLTFKFCFT